MRNAKNKRANKYYNSRKVFSTLNKSVNFKCRFYLKCNGHICSSENPINDCSFNNSLNTIYGDNYTKYTDKTQLKYKQFNNTLQNRRGYINEGYNYNYKQYLERNKRGFANKTFNNIKYPYDRRKGYLIKDGSSGICHEKSGFCQSDACDNDRFNRIFSRKQLNSAYAEYKPSNKSFSNQGAVSGGSRINKLKYQTVLKSQLKKYDNDSRYITNGVLPASLYVNTGPQNKELINTDINNNCKDRKYCEKNNDTSSSNDTSSDNGVTIIIIGTPLVNDLTQQSGPDIHLAVDAWYNAYANNNWTSFDASYNTLDTINNPPQSFKIQTLDNSDASNIQQWNISQVQDMSGLFQGKDFSKIPPMLNGTNLRNNLLTNWDVINVTTMNSMFKDAINITAVAFKNHNIASNVKDMSHMFDGARDISSVAFINTKNVEDMSYMFANTQNNLDPNIIYTVFDSTESVKNLEGLFENAINFDNMFTYENFGKKTGNVTNMSKMFKGASKFNNSAPDNVTQEKFSINTSNVENMSEMFYGAVKFNREIEVKDTSWNVSKVTDMKYMFRVATQFNQDISRWDVSKVTDMSFMFENATDFNQPIGSWGVSKVTNMNSMFNGANNFNQDITGWDVSKVEYMISMFSFAASFNQPIGIWDTSGVKSMDSMFFKATAFN